MEELKSYAIDSPDERDIIEEEFGAGETGAIPNEIKLLNTPFQNQGSTPACSCFTAGHLGTELDRLDMAKFYDGFELWKEALKRGASETEGWSNTAALNMMKDLGIIGGFTRAITVDAYINAIASGKGGYLGTNKCDWRKTGETGVFSYTENGAGHFFMGCGYNLEKKVLYAKNSWGITWGPKGGIFEIPFDQVHNLYSLYVVYDKKDKHLFDDNKKQIMDNIKIPMAKVAVELGLSNGTTPQDKASREETLTMIMRGIEGVLNGSITKEKILELKNTYGIK